MSKYGEFRECHEDTDIFIFPGYSFQAIDGLITNFHLPKSTLVMLVSAFATKDQIIADSLSGGDRREIPVLLVRRQYVHRIAYGAE